MVRSTFYIDACQKGGKNQISLSTGQFSTKKSRKIVGIAIKTSDYAKNSLEFGEEYNVYVFGLSYKKGGRMTALNL